MRKTMCVRILSNSSLIKLKAEMVVTTCFATLPPCIEIPTNEQHSGLQGTPVRIQHVEEIFFCLDVKKFLYTCEKDK
jgi:hypothetical protein